MTIPLYLRVAGAILDLAHGVFYTLDLGGPDQERTFETWKALRRTVRLICERYALQLSPAEGYDLREALKRCPPCDLRDFVLSQTFTERG